VTKSIVVGVWTTLTFTDVLHRYPGTHTPHTFTLAWKLYMCSINRTFRDSKPSRHRYVTWFDVLKLVTDLETTFSFVLAAIVSWNESWFTVTLEWPRKIDASLVRLVANWFFRSTLVDVWQQMNDDHGVKVEIKSWTNWNIKVTVLLYKDQRVYAIFTINTCY
jgi:hypothetical protein